MSFKGFVWKHVIQTTDVQIAEYRGQQIVIELFQAFQSDPERLLPTNTYRRWLKNREIGLEKRAIVDYLAGMTDEYAFKMHHNLFGTK